MSTLLRSSRTIKRTITFSIPKYKTATTTTTATRTRTMASAPAEKFEWLVILPDSAGALAKRMEVRPKHFEGLQAGVDSGFWKMGGAILEEVPKEGEGLKIQGSAMVALASSKEELLETLKNDIYAKSDVWDFSKVQIYPYKCAFRHP